MGFLKSARLILGTPVVADGGTTGADGGVKNASNSAVERSSAVLGDGGGTAQRVDAGREERFVAIDVSHPCEDVLVHEQGLDLATALHDSTKRRPIDPQDVILCNGQRSADVTLGPVQEPDSPEATDVAKAQLCVGVLQIDNEMGV